MNDIKVNEYIRTIFGDIAKIIECNDEFVLDKEIKFHGRYRSYICEEELDFIVKHSTNLIDLIEAGDYVNGNMVLEKPTKKWLNICTNIVGNSRVYDWGIKSIATKEEFENISYKVEKE